MKKNVRIQSSYIARLMAALICTASFGATSADATQYAVTNIRDSGPGSLRYAMTHVMSGDTILFSPTLMGVISLQSPLPWINGDLTIQGPLVGNLIIDGMNQNQIFFANQGTISISNFTLRGGMSKGGDGGLSSAGSGGGAMGGGGGLFVNTGAHVTLDKVSIINCFAQGGDGGGFSSIYSAGTGGGGGAGYNRGRGGDGGANFGVGGGGGGGGGFHSDGGDAMDGGGGGAGVSATIHHQLIAGNGHSAVGTIGGNGGNGYSGPVAQGKNNGMPGDNADPLVGGGGGGGGGVSVATFNGGKGGAAGAIGGGGGGGGGAKGGLGGSGMDFGGGAGGGGSVNSKISARGGFGGFAGGGGGGAGGILNHAGGHGARGGFGGGGGGGGPLNQGGAGGAGLGGMGGPNSGGGGGGAALGGAVFVRSGGSLKMSNGTFSNNSVVGGMGGQNDNSGKNGKAKGRDMYIMKSAVVFLENVASHSQMGLDLQGEGTVVFDSSNVAIAETYSKEEADFSREEADFAAEIGEENAQDALVFMTKEAWDSLQQGA